MYDHFGFLINFYKKMTLIYATINFYVECWILKLKKNRYVYRLLHAPFISNFKFAKN